MRTHLIPREPQSPPTGPTSQHHVAGEGRGGLRIRSTPPPQKITPIKRTIVQHRSKWKTFHVGKDVRTAAPSASLVAVRNGAAAVETGQGGGSSVQRAQTHTRASRPSWAGAWRTGRRASDGCGCRAPASACAAASSTATQRQKQPSARRQWDGSTKCGLDTQWRVSPPKGGKFGTQMILKDIVASHNM